MRSHIIPTRLWTIVEEKLITAKATWNKGGLPSTSTALPLFAHFAQVTMHVTFSFFSLMCFAASISGRNQNISPEETRKYGNDLQQWDFFYINFCIITAEEMRTIPSFRMGLETPKRTMKILRVTLKIIARFQAFGGMLDTIDMPLQLAGSLNKVARFSRSPVGPENPV